MSWHRSNVVEPIAVGSTTKGELKLTLRIGSPPHDNSSPLLFWASRSVAILRRWPGLLRGKAAGLGPADASEGTRVCSRDEREAAGNCPVGLFLFHPPAGGQSLDTAR